MEDAKTDSVNLAVNLGDGAVASQPNGDDPNYIRDLRKKITRMAYRGDRLDGKSHRPNIAAALAKHALDAGEYRGLSGEDTMTLLAYNALLKYEQATDMLIENINLNVSQRIVNLDSGSNEPPAK